MRAETKMTIEIADEATQITVGSVSGEIVNSSSVAAGAKTFDAAIVLHIKNKHHLRIGERTAEAIRLQIGAAVPVEPQTMDVRARHITKDVHQTISLTAEEIREALAESVLEIVKSVRVVCETMPPELIAAVKQGGIMLKGENDLTGLDRLLTLETALLVRSRIRPKRSHAINIWSRSN